MECGAGLYPGPVLSTPSSPWRNWGKTQEVYAQQVLRPSTLEELQRNVKEAFASSQRLRAVATGLSFSDILQAEDTLLEVTGLMGCDGAVLLPLEEELWKPRPLYPPPAPLVRIVCGARIRHLNASLACAGLGFENLGGYDGQTMIGSISTSTHGSGISLPPLSDGVCALDLITRDGQFLHIEPEDGLTCRELFSKRYGTSRTLIQCDQYFNATRVSLGCMGVIYSVTMRVRAAYRLRETRTIRKWGEVQAELLGMRSPLYRTRNYEVLINPYPDNRGDHSCLVTERRIAEPDLPTVAVPDLETQALGLTFLPSSQAAILSLVNHQPRLVPTLLNTGLAALATTRDNVDDSYAIYNIGSVNTADVWSGEYFFPVAEGRFLRGVQALLDAVAHNSANGIYHPSPLALRFVAGSQAYLSMTRREPHATIEMSMFRQQHGAIEALLSYERACMNAGGRPHWGELHLLTGEPGWLTQNYPDFPLWHQVYRALNPRGTFDNHFTDRVIRPAVSV
jgi:FAD/FMN-containing dehydrogenase